MKDDIRDKYVISERGFQRSDVEPYFEHYAKMLPPDPPGVSSFA